MIAFRNFALRRGQRLLLSDVDCVLHDGWRVGVVGRNGSGKSSLFAAIRGEVEADRGDIDVPNRLRIASVAQETPSLPDPAIDFVLSGDAAVHAAISAEAAAMAREDWEAVAHAHHDLEERGGYDAAARAAKLLYGLGFDTATHAQAVASFSGGWRVRLNLARALMTPSDLLLLDEPTNHLDLDAVLWLEQWLLKYPGTLLLISHDREFLDNVATHTLHLHEGRAKLYTGDYTAFERQRAEQLRQQQIMFVKEQAEREHLEAFIARFKAKASKAKQAQSRMKRLAKLAGTEAVRAERSLHIELPVPARLPHSLLRLNHVDAGYAATVGATPVARSRSLENSIATGVAPTAARGSVTILRDVNFGLEAGDRVALLGVNGAGKSTLVKTLVGELPLLAGERGAHPDLVIGYFAQHTVESLREGASPIDHLRQLSTKLGAPTVSTQVLRDFLGKWNFAGDRAFEVIDTFSGGERARLALALIAWRQPNVLLLDEPTNHLDLDMREALAEALSVFDGAIVLVSHDRHLIGLVCDTFWRVADGHVEPFDGDLDQYAAWLRARPAGGASALAATSPAAASGAAETSAAPRGSAPGRAAKVNQQRLSKLEAEVGDLVVRMKSLEGELAEPALYADGGKRAAAIVESRTTVMRRLADAEAELLELYAADAA